MEVKANGVTNKVRAACRERNQPSHVIGVDLWLVGLPLKNSYRPVVFAPASRPRSRPNNKILTDLAFDTPTRGFRDSDFDAYLGRVKKCTTGATLFDQVAESE